MRIVDVKQIAATLSVKPSTVYQWAELRQIPHMKLNGSLRFDLDDIYQWVKDCKKMPESDYNPIAQTARGPRKGVTK